MEEEKEVAEEKEEEEDEDEGERLHLITGTSTVDSQNLPIMHWEDLSQRIAELEQQEQERSERSKNGMGPRMDDSKVGLWKNVWEQEDEDFRRCRVAQRFHNHRNLQLCFINNSESEDEDDGSGKKVSRGSGCHAAGLKQEVVTALRALRDKLLAEQQEKENLKGSGAVAKRKHLERWELQECSLQQLGSLRASLQQDVHALSSELVAHLLVRDQMRTKQDAMLLDVQDLT
ncbi:uncharacterized protein LOC142892035 [Nelusetta ayraudi]|uniref:uncharacterized protein LOC142892035 n=1 Tax=Nelusetta ayraudi TaxID=303726 RepID=UPI003F7105B4